MSNAWQTIVTGDGATHVYIMQDSGTTMSDSVGTLSGVYNGSPGLSQASPFYGTNYSTRFNGTSGQYASFSSFPALGTAFTIETVVEWNSLRGAGNPNGFWQIGSESNFLLRVSDLGKRAGQLNGNVAGVAWPDPGVANDVAAGTVYHIAVTYNGTSALLYLNGTQIAGITATGAVGAGVFNLPWDWSNGRESDCWIGGIAVTPTALSGATIQNHSNAAILPQGVYGTTFNLSLAAPTGSVTTDSRLRQTYIEANTISAALPRSLTAAYIETSVVPSTTPRGVSSTYIEAQTKPVLTERVVGTLYIEALVTVRNPFIGWGAPV